MSFSEPSARQDWKRPALIFICALAAAMSLAIRGNSCGHDFDFHIQSWMAVSQQWHHGVLYPRWLDAANFGAGEPRFVFYPPLSWMLGAVLGTLMPWSATPFAFTLIILAASAFTMYKLACHWLPSDAATAAACAFILNPYALFVAYERTAYGELAAAIWLPLLVLYSLRLTSLEAADADSPQLASETWVSCHKIIALALAIAAIWLTNAPAAVMATYALGAIALWQSISQRRYQPILNSAISLILGLGLASFYLVPAAYERRWVDIVRAIGPDMRIQDSFLFAHTGGSFHDQVLHTASWVFVMMLATIFVAGCIVWKQTMLRRLLKPLFVTAIVLFVLQLPISSPIWNHAPELKFLQFPWRFSLILSLIFAIAIGAATILLKSTQPIAKTSLLLAIIFGAAATGCWLFWQPCDDEDAVSAQLEVFKSGNGFPGTDEYTPLGADNSEIPQGLPEVRLLKSADSEIGPSTNPDQETPTYTPDPQSELSSKINIEEWQPPQKIFAITAPGSGFAVVRLMDYPAWQVRINGVEAGSRPQRDDGLMAVPINPGSNRIEITYTATTDVLWGRGLTAASLLTLVIFGIVRRKHPRLGYH